MKNRLSSQRALFALLGAVLLAGCATWQPLAGVPITVEDSNYYELTKAHASYRDGVLLVSGDFALRRGTAPPKAAHFHARVFNAAGALVATAPARLVRDSSQQGVNDLRLDASFYVKIPVPRDQVARIELDYDDAADPAPAGPR